MLFFKLVWELGLSHRGRNIGWGFIYLTHQQMHILTYSMAQSPSWEANWFAVIQEIPRISRNPKVHYRTHKRPPPVSILGQPNPVHIPTSWRSFLILSTHLRLGLPSGLFPSGFPTNTLYTPPLLTHTRHLPSPSPEQTSRMWVFLNKVFYR